MKNTWVVRYDTAEQSFVLKGYMTFHFTLNSYLTSVTLPTLSHTEMMIVKSPFLAAFNTLMGSREELIANCRLAQTVLCDSKKIDTELDELHREIKVVTELSRKAIHDNARVAQSQDEFNERNNGYLDRYRKTMDRVSEFENKKRVQKTKNLIIDAFIREIESRPLGIDEFDDRLWAVAVDSVTVTANGGLMFSFKDGSEASE